MNAGDIVKSLSGRDENGYFLVIKVENGYAIVADGKTRRINNPKRKNLKHLSTVKIKALEGFSERINRGEPVGNEALRKAIRDKIKTGGNGLCQKTT